MVQPAINYIALEPDRPKRVRFDSWRWDDREITDPASKRVKKVRVMALHAISEDGVAVDRELSALAAKLQSQLAPLIETGTLFTREVTIVWHPRGYATEYEVRLS